MIESELFGATKLQLKCFFADDDINLLRSSVSPFVIREFNHHSRASYFMRLKALNFHHCSGYVFSLRVLDPRVLNHKL